MNLTLAARPAFSGLETQWVALTLGACFDAYNESFGASTSLLGNLILSNF